MRSSALVSSATTSTPARAHAATISRRCASPIVRPVGLWWSGIVTASRGAAAASVCSHAPASQPAGRERDRDGACAHAADRREAARVGRRVDEHAVARRAQQPQHEVQRVLGAGRDEHLVGRRVDAALAEAAGDRGAQLRAGPRPRSRARGRGGRAPARRWRRPRRAAARARAARRSRGRRPTAGAGRSGAGPAVVGQRQPAPGAARADEEAVFAQAVVGARDRAAAHAQLAARAPARSARGCARRAGRRPRALASPRRARARSRRAGASPRRARRPAMRGRRSVLMGP